MRKVKVSRKRIFLLVGSIIIFALLLLTFAQIYLNLNLLLGNDVLINLDADKDFIAIKNGEQGEVAFTTSVRTNPFCSAHCIYSFTDVSTGEIIDHQSFELRAVDPLKKYYTVTTEKGEGSKLYRYSVTCTSNRTFFCQTEGKPRARFLTVALNHTLNETQSAAKNRSREALEELENDRIMFLERAASINRTYSNITDYLSYEDIRPNVTQGLRRYEVALTGFRQVWDSEEYIKLSEDIDAWEGYQEMTTVLRVEESNLRNAINMHNALRSALDTMKDNLSSRFLISNASLRHALFDAAETLNDSIEYFNGEATVRTKQRVVQQSLDEIEQITERAQEAHEDAFEEHNETLVNASRVLCSITQCPYVFKNSHNTTQELCEDTDNFYTIYRTLNTSQQALIVTAPQNCTLSGPYNITSIQVPALAYRDVNRSTQDPRDLPENPPQCCALGSCEPCCPGDGCTEHPIVFIHGHAISEDTPPDYNIDSFNNLQAKLEDEGIINMGRISLYDYLDLPRNVWGQFSKPVSLKISYYYDIYSEHDTSIIVATKNENLDTYAVRLNDIIESVRFKTQSDKVIIMAHSMGGLVARRYMQIFGSEHVEKIMTFGTPHNGTYGIIADLCPVFGGELECRDMHHGSLFLNKLNSKPLPDIPFYNAVAVGCDMGMGSGDGVILNRSAWLPGARNFQINGSCQGPDTLHTEFIKNADEGSKLYNIVLRFLAE